MYMFYYCILVLASYGVQYSQGNLCQSQAQKQQQQLDASGVSAVTTTIEPCFDVSTYQYTADRKGTQGSELTLECNVAHKSSYAVSWTRNNHLLTVNGNVIPADSSHVRIDTDGASRYNLVLDQLDAARHAGIYECSLVSESYPIKLVYRVDVLVPPQITRIPALNEIVLDEGGSLLVQCLTTGNPKPELTYSKHQGEKGKHTRIDVSNSSMQLTNVDESYSGLYSCTATNGVGIPVTSEFQIFIRFKPRVKFSEDANIHQNVMYTSVGKFDQIRCLVEAYPRPVMSLLRNGSPVSEQSYTFEKSADAKDQYVLTYSLVGSVETFGIYECIAKNDQGTTVAELKVTPHISTIKLSLADKHLEYSDVVFIEWSLFSGSSLSELNIQVYNENGSNFTSEVKRANPISLSMLVNENEEAVAAAASAAATATPPTATYHSENPIEYKGYLDVIKLAANTTYTIRMRAKNEFGEWSEWSHNMTVHTGTNKPHRGSAHVIHHHYRTLMHAHLAKHKHYQLAAGSGGSRDLNGGKRDKYNADMFENAATATTTALFSSSLLLIVLYFVTNSIIFV